MPIVMPKLDITEIENIGHAMSILIQQRFVWIFHHIIRASYLSTVDSGYFPHPADNFFFSEEDRLNGAKPFLVHEFITFVHPKVGVFASSEDDSAQYDYKYVREITRDGIRSSILIAFQSYLEFYRIESIYKKYNLSGLTRLIFLRQSRNIICHANGMMSSARLVKCTWKNKTIENNGMQLKMSDQSICDLIDEIIEDLSELYTSNGKTIDYVSLNLGASIPKIREIANSISKKQA
jgi:hypothetical protein